MAKGGIKFWYDSQIGCIYMPMRRDTITAIIRVLGHFYEYTDIPSKFCLYCACLSVHMVGKMS